MAKPSNSGIWLNAIPNPTTSHPTTPKQEKKVQHFANAVFPKACQTPMYCFGSAGVETWSYCLYGTRRTLMHTLCLHGGIFLLGIWYQLYTAKLLTRDRQPNMKFYNPYTNVPLALIATLQVLQGRETQECDVSNQQPIFCSSRWQGNKLCSHQRDTGCTGNKLELISHLEMRLTTG